MKKNTIFKTLLICVCILALPNILNAGKLKSSKSYIKILERAVKPLDKDLDSLSSIISGINSPKSFITTDFWGLKPSWYASGMRYDNLSTAYPYTQSWVQQSGVWSQHVSDLVRNINGIILNPAYISLHRGDPKSWKVDLNVDFDYSPGYMSMDYYKRYVMNYLASNGVPSSRRKAALDDFSSRVDAATTYISKNIYTRFDRMYHGNAKIGQLRIYETIARELDKVKQISEDDYFSPSRHSRIFTKKVFNKYGLSYGIRSIKKVDAQLNDEMKGKTLFEYYRNVYHLSVSVPLFYFKVASKANKSKRYNQIMKLKAMLDKKVATGKVKRYKKGKYTVYEDSFDKYTRGRIGIDFKTGIGYWQLPIWNDKKYFDYYISKINKSAKKVNIALKKFFALSLDETVKKFKSNGSQTSGF